MEETMISFVFQCEGVAVVVFVLSWCVYRLFYRFFVKQSMPEPTVQEDLKFLVETGELDLHEAIDIAYEQGYNNALEE